MEASILAPCHLPLEEIEYQKNQPKINAVSKGRGTLSSTRNVQKEAAYTVFCLSQDIYLRKSKKEPLHYFNASKTYVGGRPI